MAFTIDGTAGETFPDGTTQATGVPAPGTSGNVLVSNGTAWTSGASSGITLLGTISVTGVNSLSLGSLNLTSYKALFIIVNSATSAGIAYVSSDNRQSGGGFNLAGSASGTFWLDLGTGAFGGGYALNTITAVAANTQGGLTNVSTSTTTIYFRAISTNIWNTGGSLVIYGVK